MTCKHDLEHGLVPTRRLCYPTAEVQHTDCIVASLCCAMASKAVDIASPNLDVEISNAAQYLPITYAFVLVK